MYEECVRCSKLGSTCNGPNFFAMTTKELTVWCRERKKYLGLSNSSLAEKAGMAKGTVDSLLAGQNNDFNYESIRPIIKALGGAERMCDPCPKPETNDQQTIKFLNRESDRSQVSIAYLKKVILVLSLLLGLAVVTICAAIILGRLIPM